MIEDHRRELGITPCQISNNELVQRLVLALANEDAHALEEKIAARTSNIDMVYLTGYGFPVWRGQPAKSLRSSRSGQVRRRDRAHRRYRWRLRQPRGLITREVTVSRDEDLREGMTKGAIAYIKPARPGGTIAAASAGL